MEDQEPKRKRGRPPRRMPEPIKGVDARTLANKVLNSRRRRRDEWEFVKQEKNPPKPE